MQNKSMLLALIILIACLLPVATDIYAPSIPAVASSLAVSTHLVQFTLAIYLLGVCATQLFYGALSEVYGRRNCILFGLVVVLLGSLVCFLAHNIYILLLGRFIQGCGASACKLIGAILKDSFDDKQLPKVASIMHIAVAIVLPSAPAIGGILQHAFSWHASFMFIFVYALINIILVYALLQETSQHHSRERLSLSFILPAYKKVISNRIFLSFSFSNLITYGAMFSWAASMPVLFQKQLGMSARSYGITVFLVAASAMILGSYANTRLVHKLENQNILRTGWLLGLLSGIVMWCSYYLVGINAAIILIAIWLFVFGSALVWPYTFACAFKPFADMAGYASAMFAATQLLGGFVLGSLVAYLPENNQLPLAYILLATAAACLLIHQFIAKPALASYSQ